MIKWETIKREFNTRYVIRSKKGNYLTENDGWTKCLKKAYRFTNLWGASYMVENDFKNCKVVEVKLCTWQAVVGKLDQESFREVRLRTWQAIEEIGEVKE